MGPIIHDDNKRSYDKKRSLDGEIRLHNYCGCWCYLITYFYYMNLVFYIFIKTKIFRN